MSNNSARNGGVLLVLLSCVRSVWDWLRSWLLSLDERTRLNLLLTIFNIMLLTVVIFALLNRQAEIRYITVEKAYVTVIKEIEIVQAEATAGQARATAAQAAGATAQVVAYSDGVANGATKAVDEFIGQLTATASAQPTVLPTPGSPTPPPVVTTFTPPPPTATPTPPLPTATFTPRPPTATPTSPPPPTTEVPTSPPPPPTKTFTPTPVPPPTILTITPNQGVNSAPVPVVIRGANFFGTPTVRLGASVFIAISAATADTLTGTVPAGITPGVYALVVENPDGQSAMLSPAYTALIPVTTLETGDLMTFGTALTSPGNGDNDQVQVVFFEIPDTVTDTLYIRILDPDVGGSGAFDEQQGGGWDTSTNFSLYGGSGAYNPAACRATFATTSDPGIRSGSLIISRTFAVSNTWEGIWYLFAAITPNQGEAVGNKRVFKLSVVGANSGDDGNRYNVALSTDPVANVPPAGSRILAYSWTFSLPRSTPQRMYPYVRTGASFFEQHNWDMDGAIGTLTLLTPIRSIAVPGSGISGNGAEAWSRYRVDANEDGATWTVTMDFATAGPWDDLTFWAEDGAGVALAMFTHMTTNPPP